MEHRDGHLQFFCFRVGTRIFALDIMGIREILRKQPITPLPDAPPGVAGIINVRGKLITVLDPGVLFHIRQERPEVENPRVVIAGAGNDMIGILIDAVIDVTSIPPESLSPVPSGPQAQGNSILGMFRRQIDEVEQVVLLVRLGSLIKMAKGEGG